MIDKINKNIDTEIEILREISHYNNLLQTSNPVEARLISQSIDSLLRTLKIINNSVPTLLSNISLAKKLPSSNSQSESAGLEDIRVQRAVNEVSVSLNPQDKERFIRELSISEEAISKIKGKRKKQVQEVMGIQKSRGYVKLSNRIFLSLSQKIINKGHFRPLAVELQKGNMNLLLESYLATTFLTILISFFVSLILMFVLGFLDTASEFPYIQYTEQEVYLSILKLVWLPIVVPVAVFLFMYYYPSTEKSTIAKRIDQELPFAVIHMSAISGSGIEPTNIFKIIALSKEYPYLRKEIRKVLNQINLYGYDLVTALNNISKATPSERLAELFAGLSTTIHSGGDLTEFFEKRAETLLVNYKLEREKFTRTAETFMDIYITIAVAAPMVLLLVMILLSLSFFDMGLSPGLLTLLIIGILGAINAGFLVLLNVKQPTY